MAGCMSIDSSECMVIQHWLSSQNCFLYNYRTFRERRIRQLALSGCGAGTVQKRGTHSLTLSTTVGMNKQVRGGQYWIEVAASQKGSDLLDYRNHNQAHISAVVGIPTLVVKRVLYWVSCPKSIPCGGSFTMLSSLCHHLSVSCAVLSPSAKNGKNVFAKTVLRSATCSLSTRTQEQPQEVVSVLRLNMLQDNPGAIKKVWQIVWLEHTGRTTIEMFFLNFNDSRKKEFRKMMGAFFEICLGLTSHSTPRLVHDCASICCFLFLFPHRAWFHCAFDSFSCIETSCWPWNWFQQGKNVWAWSQGTEGTRRRLHPPWFWGWTN